MDPSALEDQLGSWRTWYDDEVPIRVGISACLLGQEVRHDGGHARDRFVAEVLTRWIEWTPVCPEVELGLGVPRPTIRLVDVEGETRLVTSDGSRDFTDGMLALAERRIGGLLAEGLDGYLFKKNSPSCGMERVKVYRAGHTLHKKGRGLFADALLQSAPTLPVEEDGRLNDPRLREGFIERVFAHNRWRTFLHRGPSRERLVRFHTAHKMLLRAHGEAGYRELGRLVGRVEPMSDAELYRRYEELFQRTLQSPATPRRHVNVMQHALGYLKRELDAREKAEILTVIEDYRAELLPLAVPLALLRLVVRKHGIEYLQGQLYLDPHPKELALRTYT